LVSVAGGKRPGELCGLNWQYSLLKRSVNILTIIDYRLKSAIKRGGLPAFVIGSSLEAAAILPRKGAGVQSTPAILFSSDVMEFSKLGEFSILGPIS
jgi:hypothetical protein